MKIELKRRASVTLPEGSVIDVDDNQAKILLAHGVATPVEDKPKEKAVKEPKTEKKTKKK